MEKQRYLIIAAVLLIAAVIAILVARIPDESVSIQSAAERTDREDVRIPIVGDNEPAARPLREEVSEEFQQDDVPITFSCPEPEFPNEMNFAAMAEALQHSDDPEHLLMATLFGGSDQSSELIRFPAERNLDALFRGLKIQPRNELLLWNAMTLCADAASQGRCDEYDVPELATAVLGDNATFWYRLAAIRADAEDMDGAFAALYRSFGAPEYNEYFVEHVELFARGIAAFNNAPYNERVMAGFGMAAAQQSAESEILRACQQQAPGSPKWLSICIALGERMEARGRTMLSVMLGLGLQKNMYEISGDDLRAQAAERQMDSRRRLIDELLDQTYENTVLSHDERVLEGFVDVWKAGGEFSAMQYLQRETRRLMNTPGYQPCAMR